MLYVSLHPEVGKDSCDIFPFFIISPLFRQSKNTDQQSYGHFCQDVVFGVFGSDLGA